MAEAHGRNHAYHIVDPSPWPLTASVGAFVTAIGAIGLFRWRMGEHLELGGVDLANPWLFLAGLALVLYTMYGWWADVVKEANGGHHTPVVSLHLRYGMILFIASEVMFFVAWFWAWFDAAFYPDDVKQVMRTAFTGGVWPPHGVETFDPWHLPLLNTLILLLSGTTVTWAHHALLEGDRQGLRQGLSVTVVLGFLFTCLQAYEYSHAHFGFSGSIYGAAFFMATGFHGFHVIVGTIFLAICLIRANKGHFTPKQHFGFEAATWYWHFVDVVWLFLFVCIYVFGRGVAGAH
ncbi:cytochrome c oxidase subunit 3 [Pinisolibacter aquiterrae]|uniref:cytochrome c oxidase subunit 3 n=1 Tax=Pinisolibacter aquiterrae TaxID=2815579 RepID=UPI001C3CE098|nr:cytochrome c oxidase subunit 3 [Pinisolibacter aquiterrae]MBV5266683.1 cytochrome c oxidase subunit 3 [Pinisolibacter aquiterrae]MCC8235004.1 cytochrome c oxidase subunit 3 [Pinisolibacter aquiterrae]